MVGKWKYVVNTLFFTILQLYGYAGCSRVDLKNHPVWEFLDSFECGQSAADRIIGGINAALGQFPWSVRLGYVSNYDSDWMCGGALISDRHILSAAHCLLAPEDYKLKYVRLGEYNTETNPDCQLHVCAPPYQDIDIKVITKHENFDKPAFHNDIAILELVKPAILHDYVSPICLPRGSEMALRVGDYITVAGWGKMNETTDERAKILQVVTLPIVEPELCNIFGIGYKSDESEICAGGQQNHDACGGDSGGPLMKVLDTPEGPKTHLLGVVSFGPSVCGIKKPAVYSYVPYFLKWILDNIKI